MIAARLADLGIVLRDYHPGTHRGRCWLCDRGPGDDALAVTIEADGGAVWFCHRCQWAGTTRTARRDALSRPVARPAPRPPPTPAPALADDWRRFWRDCPPITPGSVAARYLEGRACRLPPQDGDLRWHPAALHWPTRTRHPALIGQVTDALTGEPLTLHMTFLAADGSGKAAIERPRLLLPKHKKAGGVIRLWPDDAVARGLLIGEGIETCLAAAHAFTPVWAAIDAGNLAALPVLDGVEALTIAADHDPAGIKAAKSCAERWAAAGVEVRIAMATTPGADLADVGVAA